jgi:hypothetical protein
VKIDVGASFDIVDLHGTVGAVISDSKEEFSVPWNMNIKHAHDVLLAEVSSKERVGVGLILGM